MRTWFKLFSILVLFGCHNNKSKGQLKSFDSFVFSYSAEDLAYSMKFTFDSDTTFLGISFPEKGNKYFAIIQVKDKKMIDSFLSVYKLSSFDTTYIQEHLNDGIEYKFYLTKDTTKNWVYIYGQEGPKELYLFANWLTNFKEQLKFYPYNGKVKFGDLKYIELPIVSPPPRENKNNR